MSVCPPADEAACAALAAVLSDSDQPQNDRVDAATQLGRIGSGDAVRALLAELGDTYTTVRAASARGLAGIGQGAVDAVPALVEALTHSDKATRSAAADALSCIDPKLRIPIDIVREAVAIRGLPFRVAFESTSVPTGFVDNRGYVMWANAALQGISSLLKDTFTTTPWTPLLRDDLLGVFADWEQMLRGAVESTQAELSARTPDGQRRWLLLNASLVAEPAADSPCVSVVAQDITELKRTQLLHQVLYEISEAAHASTAVPNLLRATYGSLSKLMSSTDFAVLLLDIGAADPYANAHWMSTENDYASETVSVIKSRSRRVIESGKPLCFKEQTTLDLVAAGELELGGSAAGAWLGAPLILDERCIGVLRLKDEEHEAPYSVDDMQTLTFVGREVGAAIGHLRAYAELDEERRLFSALMDNVPDSVYFKTPASKFLRVNTAMAEDLGLRHRADAVGMSDHDYFSEADAEVLRAAEQEAMATGVPLVGSILADRRPGLPDRWVQSTKIPLTDVDGTSTGLVGITRDVTDLIDAQEELRRANADLEERVQARTSELQQQVAEHRLTAESLARVMETARCFLWEAEVEDIDGRLDWSIGPLNEAALDRLFPLDRSSGTSLTAAIAQSRLREDSARMAQVTDAALRSGQPAYEQDYRAIDKYGALHWLHEDVRIEPIGARRWRVVGVTTDVTERRRAEEDLRRGEERFRRIFEEGPLGMAIVGRDRRLVEANETLAGMLGYDKAALASMPLRDLVHPDDLARPAQPTGALQRGQRPTYQTEARYRRADGSTMWGRVTSAAVFDDRGSRLYDVYMVEDVTEAKRAEALRRALYEISEAARSGGDLHEFYGSIHRSLSEIIDAPEFTIALQDADDPDVFDFVFWVDAAATTAEGPQAIYIPGSRTALVAAAAETLYLTAAESKRMAADGEIELHGSSAAAWLGVPLLVDDRLLGVARLLRPGVEDPYTPRDVEMMTYVGQQIALAIDRRQTQDALDHERQLFNALMDSTPDAIYFKDTESRFIRANRVTAKQLGRSSADDLVGTTDADHGNRPGVREYRAEEAHIIRTGEPLVGKVQGDVAPGQTGEPTIWTHVTKTPMRNAEGEIVGLVGVNREISDWVNAQTALTESERQRAALVQRIVTVQEEERARIARELHDQVGQDLTSVLLGLRAAERVPPADSLSFIADARKQTSATLETVRQIAFDMHPSSMQDVGLAAALERDLVLLGEQAGLDTSFRSAPGAVPDLSKERQVGLYRMVHAALTNTVQHGQAASVSVVLTSSATQVSVMVGDDGVGFDVDAVLAGPVEGRFGLLALDERARMLKGRVSVESSPGEGAAVFIEIPTEAAL